MRAHFIDVDRVRTRYLTAGSGPAVFLLHGVGMSGDTFARNIDVLGEAFTVIAPDMLGHGFTDAVGFAGEAPQAATVRHLDRLADLLGFESYSVLGSSYGGLIAALMWFSRPLRVGDLVLVGSGSVFHPPAEQRRTLRAAAANATQALGDPTLASCRRRMAAICHSPNAVAEEILLAQLTAYALPDRLSTYQATIEGLIASLDSHEHTVFERLERLEARTLIIVGHDDVRSDWRRHVEGRRRMTNASMVIVEQCGHLPYMEHPASFNAMVHTFLTGTAVGE
jgi:pimeloyl-ACP methyl ester carboxylesterase